MGDVQFDDEGGEGDTMVVERERDLALSRAGTSDDRRHRRGARAADHRSLRLLDRVRPADPARAPGSDPVGHVLVEEKVGGIGRR